MPKFTDLGSFTPLPDGRTWLVASPVRYCPMDNCETAIIVPWGFKTDFASSPRWTWWMVPPIGRYTCAAVLHDYLLTEKRMPYDIADKMFDEAMEALGVRWWRRKLIYYAVRLHHTLFTR